MKMIIMIALVLMSVGSLFSQETSAVPPSNVGNLDAGTAQNPYLIQNLANLRWVSEQGYSWWVDDTTPVYFLQTDDIDATETAYWNSSNGFLPIGYRGPFGGAAPSDPKFIGEYDGGGHSITSLTMYSTTVNSIMGLVSTITGHSTIRDVHLVGLDIVVYVTNGGYVYIGGLAGLVPLEHTLTIQDCSVSGGINATANTTTIGGLVGMAIGETNIYQSSFNGYISSYSGNNLGDRGEIGGLVGFLRSGTIQRSYSSISLYATSTPITAEKYAGGIVGSMMIASILNCYSGGYISMPLGSTGYAGGIVGNVGSFGTIAKTYARMEFSGMEIIGGIAAYSDSDVSDSVWNYLYNIDVNAVGDGDPNVTNTAGLFTPQMMGTAAYLARDWNFSTIWHSDLDRNEGYPFLRALPYPDITPRPEDLTAEFTPITSPIVGSDGNIMLSWNPPIGISYLSRYLIYKDGVDLDLQELADNTTYQDFEVYLDNLYHYGVAAQYYVEQGSKVSGPREIDVLVPIYNPPLNLVATPGNTTITLTWEPPASQNYGEVSYYNLYYDDMTLVAGNISGLTYQDTGLTNGQIYEYYVTAFYTFAEDPTKNDESESSNYDFTTPEDGIPSDWERPSNYDDPDAGTANNAYIIANLANLRWASEVPEDWWIDSVTPIYFIQTNDIDASPSTSWNGGAGFIPIGYRGTVSVPEGPQFIGEYDGGDFTINNLYINITEISGLVLNVGLFAEITGPTVIKNVHLVDHNIFTNVNRTSSVGAIVGSMSNTATLLIIENCSAQGSIEVHGQSSFVGGIIGGASTNHSISRSFTKGSILSYGTSFGSIAGGIIGQMNYGSITESFSSAFVFSHFIDGTSIVGGIIGRNRNATITNCYFDGYLSYPAGAPGYSGGIVGSTYSSMPYTISKTYSRGIHEPSYLAGAIVGFSENVNLQIHDSVWNSDLYPDIDAIGSGSGSISRTTGLPTAQMMGTDEYLDREWNFTTIWMSDLNKNEGYPFLRALPDQDMYPRPENVAGVFTEGPIFGIVTDGYITLTWDPPTGSMNTNQYIIYKNNVELNLPEVADNTTWADYEVFIDNIYKYGIAAEYNINQKPIRSGPSEIELLLPIYNPPRSLTAAPGDEIIDLSWLAPLPQNHGVVTGYSIYTMDGNNSELVAGDVSGLTYSVTSLTNDVEYSFFVQAIYEFAGFPEYDGESDGTDWASATPGNTLPYGCQRPSNYHDPDAGTYTNPYIIATLSNLRWMSEVPEEWWVDTTTKVYFVQIANIDATETANWSTQTTLGFRPIGYPLEGEMNFIGEYDGQHF